MDHSLQALIAAAEGIGLAEAARRGEMKNSGLSREEIDRRMEDALLVMRQSAQKGFDENLKSPCVYKAVLDSSKIFSVGGGILEEDFQTVFSVGMGSVIFSSVSSNPGNTSEEVEPCEK